MYSLYYTVNASISFALSASHASFPRARGNYNRCATHRSLGANGSQCVGGKQSEEKEKERERCRGRAGE